MWLDASAVSLLLTLLTSLVTRQALLPWWLSVTLLVELSNFLHLGLMVSLKIGSPTGVPAIGISVIGRTGEGGVPAWHAGLLVDARASEPSNPGVVSPAEVSTLGCVTVVSASLTEHTGPALGLAAAERNQGISLTELA